MSAPELPPPIDAPARTARLYDVKSIDLATFLGTCLAGALLLGLNFRALGRHAEARTAWILGLLGLVLILVAAYFIEVPESQDRLVGFLLQGAQVAALHAVTIRVLGDALRDHKRSGGEFHSGWRAAGIAIVPVVVGVGFLFYAGGAFDSEPAVNLEGVETQILAPTEVRLSQDFYFAIEIKNGQPESRTLYGIQAPLVLLNQTEARRTEPAFIEIETNQEVGARWFRFDEEIPPQGVLTVRLPGRGSRVGTKWPPILICFDGPDSCLGYSISLPVVP